MKPELSVIIPVYNTEKYLNRCLDSVFRQSLRQIEVIVVDDCSPGDTEAVLAPYLEAYANLKYFRHEKNKGLYLARLSGYTLAEGDYIAFLDSDDYVTRDFYRTLLWKARDTGADIVIGRTVIEKSDGSHFVYNYHDCALSFDILEGESVQNAFWEQEGLCYSWHTIWNKIYKRQLWETALPYLKNIGSHVIMTEDIAFSSVLFSFARRVTAVRNNGYFYCENKDASTDSSNLPIGKYTKNVQDITMVFQFVESFLKARQASGNVMEHYRQFRQYYGRMWRTHALSNYSGAERKTALSLVEALVPGLSETTRYEEHFFNTALSPWNGGLEYCKDMIADEAVEWVSFDIFDTLVTRPLYRPEDVFRLLDPVFSRLMNTNASFYKIRTEGEREAREYWGHKKPKLQDITLTQIYEKIAALYHIPEETAREMQKAEEELEIRLSHVREAGKELFTFALAAGKRVILISDMYLEKETIQTLLEKHGYRGYEHLFLSSDAGLTKHTGALFRHALGTLNTDAKQVLHIGDTWSGDIENPGKLGIRTFFLPKTKDAMENRIQGIGTNCCASIGDYACADTVNREKYRNSLGYGAALSLAANRYFDNPYRYFNPESDFNQDPYFIGYYPLGMHLLGFCKWLIEESISYGYRKLYFMSRDGYLPMLVYQKLAALYPDAPAAEYLYTSRKALMPYILEHTYDFYDMPVETGNHTPRTLLALLGFCSKELCAEEIDAELEKEKLFYDSCFRDKEEYNRFITWFLENVYDADRHEKEKELCALYYGKIEARSATVDMGYSGRIQGAVSRAAGHGVNVFFVHADERQYQVESRGKEFRIHSFYDCSPYMTGMIREHIFSSTEASCVGFTAQKTCSGRTDCVKRPCASPISGGPHGDEPVSGELSRSVAEFEGLTPDKTLSGGTVQEESASGERKNGNSGSEKTQAIPVFEIEEKLYQDRFVVEKIQKGALDFIDDFIVVFEDYYHDMPMKPYELSLPFEGYLRFMKDSDLKIFEASFFEDTVYGARKRLKISDFLRQQHTEFNLRRRLTGAAAPPQISFQDMLEERLKEKGKITKFFVLFAADQEALRVKMWYRLQGRPVLFRVCRKIYRTFWGGK